MQFNRYLLLSLTELSSAQILIMMFSLIIHKFFLLVGDYDTYIEVSSLVELCIVLLLLMFEEFIKLNLTKVTSFLHLT